MAIVRRSRARLYDELLRDEPRVQVLKRDYTTVVPHIYVVRIPGLKDRTALQSRMLARNVQTGVHYQPNHWVSFFRDPLARPLPVLDALYPELLTLPLHFDLLPSEVTWVCESLIEEIRHAGTA